MECTHPKLQTDFWAEPGSMWCSHCGLRNLRTPARGDRASTHIINPMGAPRMTQRDRWKKRPVVLKYFAFRDECKLQNVRIAKQGSSVIFVLPMPSSWSQKKRTAMMGQPHQQKPDLDNLVKALLDAVYRDGGCDGEVSSYSASKIWGDIGQIIIINP